MWYPLLLIQVHFGTVVMSWLWDKLYGGGSRSGSGDFFPSMKGGGEGKDQTPQVQGRGRIGLALIPLGWREQQKLPGNWASHVSTSRINLKHW